MPLAHMELDQEMSGAGIWCCGCSSDVQAVLCSGIDIYPHRPDLSHKSFWRCPACRNYVGCHPGGNKPLGNIPTPEIRNARGHIHAILDPIWKTKQMRRGEVYRQISEKIGHQYHTGEIKTIDEAREVYRIVKRIIADRKDEI